MWYFDIIKSNADHKLYFGSTKDLKRRIKEHNAGNVTSTKSRAPFSLVYYEAFLDEYSARNRENNVKSSRGTRSALLKRIRTDLD